MFNQFQPNIENMQQYLNNEESRSSATGDGPNWWSIPKGNSVVRILPPWDPTGRVALPVYSHRIEFQGSKMNYKKWTWTCKAKTFGKPCQICEALSKLAEAGVNIEPYAASDRKFYFNAIVMSDPTFNPQSGQGVAPGTHVLLKAPKTLYDWIIQQITNPMVGDITNVQNGIDLFITKSGERLETTYSATFSPNGKNAIPQEYLSKITELYNLDDIFSSGFDQEQVDEMAESLKKSAGVLSNGVSSAVNQMAGYTQAPMMPQQNQYQAPTQQMPTYPQGGLNYQAMAPQPQPTVAPTPYGYQAPMSAPAPSMPTPQPSQSQASNLPECYGRYDAGSPNCIVCPHEINCQNSR